MRPRAGGRLVWEDARTLAFHPDPPLQPATDYRAVLRLDRLFSGLEEGLEVFEFDFRTRERGFSVAIEGLSPESPQSLERQVLRGTVFTNDLAEVDELEGVLEAEQGGKPLSIRWLSSGAGTEHPFEVGGIRRAEAPSEVRLRWNGRSFGSRDRGERTVRVPALGDFEVLQAEVLFEDAPHVRIAFSDPLASDQDLEGLVTLSGYSGGLSYSVEGNRLLVFPDSDLEGAFTLQLAPGIRNVAGRKLPKAFRQELVFDPPKPQLRLVGTGNILVPEGENLLFPFEAIGLRQVDVEVFKIFSNNVLQFFQYNSLDGSNSLQEVGRVVLQQTLPLTALSDRVRLQRWGRYALDLAELIEPDPGAIYQVRLSFRKEYAAYPCPDAAGTPWPLHSGGQDAQGNFRSYWDDWAGIYGYDEDYHWEDRQNPCRKAYYGSHNFVRRNVLASNLGLLVKGGEQGRFFAVVTELRSGKPAQGVSLEFFDYQQQPLGSALTDGDGIATVELPRPPFAVVATRGKESGYLRLSDGDALSLSRYDVGGTQVQRGLKGFLYGERGVWRPGDTLFLNFILDDPRQTFPDEHPLNVEVLDARGQLHSRFRLTQRVENIYPFRIPTA
ncbi:MAG: hypothetical protein D6765_16935, partial [Bacteroidetes bacterium]